MTSMHPSRQRLGFRSCVAALCCSCLGACGSGDDSGTSGGHGGSTASGGNAGSGGGGTAGSAATGGNAGSATGGSGGAGGAATGGSGGLSTGGTGGTGGAGTGGTGGTAGTGGSAGSAGSAPLLLTITLHLENKTFDAAYFAALDAFAATFEAHGGRLTFEPRDQVVTAAAGPPALLDWKTLEARGHAVGSHAAIGGTNTQTLTQFTQQAQMRYTQLASRVNRLDHISGNCGNVDWVKGVTDAGFSATTAATVLCLYSMAPADRPAPYQTLNCTGPTDPTCHHSYPSELAQRIHPWRAASGAHWLTDDATGKLVIFPGSGTLPCLEEEATNPGTGLPTCTLTQADVTRALADLDGAIALTDPSLLNTFYWVWGSWSISAAEQPVLASFLDAVDQRVSAGTVQWANVQQMLDGYTAWEATHR